MAEDCGMEPDEEHLEEYCIQVFCGSWEMVWWKTGLLSGSLTYVVVEGEWLSGS